MSKIKTMYPLFLLCALGFTWGTSFSIARFAMESGITPLGYSFWQSFGPAVLVSIIAIAKDKRFFISKMEHILFYLVCGLIGICLPNLSMYFSAVHIPSGILGLIVNTSPIITYILSILFFIEKYDHVRFSGILFSFLGLFLLFYPKIDHVDENLKWLFFAFVTPLMLSFCTVFMVKYRPKNISSLGLSAGMLIAATCMITPVTFAMHQFHPISEINLPNFFILLEIILSSIGYILFFELLKVAGPVYYSLVGCIVSLSGLFWGYSIFHEQPKKLEWIAIVFIVVAIFLVSNFKAKDKL